jgi:peptidoglycan/xylan/chitin deacetylase (PgdA/CDA1 family)
VTRIALKVDVDTYRGTREGVPALLDLFQRHGVRATFLFSLGPDHTGRAIRRIFRPGFLSKVQRTSVTEHYGYRTLLYGVLLPGPHIGRRAGHVMREAQARGHEVGVHCYDHVRWQDFVAGKDEAWTRRELQRAIDAFMEVFREPPRVHGAAGWQLNRFVPSLEEALGFRYASDVRGHEPFYPVMGETTSRCLQIPTTLPTLDELIGRDGHTPDNVHRAVLQASREAAPQGHVYTLHAELEGMKLLPVMDRLLQGWRAEGFRIGALADLYDQLDLERVPARPVVFGEVPGRSGTLALEG